MLPDGRERYLAEIAQTVRAYREQTRREAEAGRDAQALERGLRDAAEAPDLRRRRDQALDSLDRELREELTGWGETRERYAAP